MAAVLSKSQIEQYYIPLVQRLSRGEWFTSRTSACALYTPVYDKVDPAVQDEMRKAFATLGSDDTPMVRRAAAKWLGVSDDDVLPPPVSLIWNIHLQDFVKKLSKPHVLSDGLAVYRRLQSDDQDSVRLLTVEDLIAIAQRLTPAEVKEQLLKQIRQTVSDKSWRVRYMAATHFNEARSLAPRPRLVLIPFSIVGRSRWTGSCPRGVDWTLRPAFEGQRG